MKNVVQAPAAPADIVKTLCFSGCPGVWHSICKSLITVSFVVNNRVMVHPSGREIGRMFSLFRRPSYGNRVRTVRQEALTQSDHDSGLPLVDKSDLTHVAWLGIRSFIRIAQTHAEGQFISIGEVQPIHIWLA